MNDPGNTPGLRGPLAAAGAAVAMIACCALPTLIAAGALTTVDGFASLGSASGGTHARRCNTGAALRSWGRSRRPH